MDIRYKTNGRSDAGTQIVVEAVKNDRPNLVLSDISMPDRDGFDLLGDIRALGPDAGGSVPERRGVHYHAFCFHSALGLSQNSRWSIAVTGPLGYFTFGFRSSCARGVFIFSLVIRFAPVSTSAGTFSPLDAANAVLTPS